MTTIHEHPAPISLSDEAVARLAGSLAAEGDDGLALRIAVRPGGCSGFASEMFFDTDTAPEDQVATLGAATVRVDPASAAMAPTEPYRRRRG